ncbi:hypothetical protein BX070DRAFT_47905 [Coemansia spiralis]|nr:hypothetical protein BX070DRAFT_47905 [Coemansia spiralis]
MSVNNAATTTTAAADHSHFPDTDPRKWSVTQVLEWLEMHLPKNSIPSTFESNRIDGSALFEGMTYSILHHDLDFKVGPALNLMRHIQHLRTRWDIIPMDAAWTGPVLDKQLDDDISFEKVIDSSYLSTREPFNEYSFSATMLEYRQCLVNNNNNTHKNTENSKEDKPNCIIPPRRIPLISTYFSGSGEFKEKNDSKSSDMQMKFAYNDATRIVTSPELPYYDNNVQQQNEPEKAAATPGSLPKKEKRRIAPCLVTSEFPDKPTGNIVEQQHPGLYAFDEMQTALLPPPSQLLPLAKARALILAEFALPASSSSNRRPTPSLHRLQQFACQKEMEADVLASPTDSFWFRRFNTCRLTADNIIRGATDFAALWQCMSYIQAWHRLHIISNDAAIYGDPECATVTDDDPTGKDTYDSAEDKVLPLYGESSDSGEYSDGLLREITKENKEQQTTNKKLADAENNRLSLVTAVIQDTLEKYAVDWQERTLPKLELRSFNLWNKYANQRTLLQDKLNDLVSRQMPNAQKSVVESGVTTRVRTIPLCEGLRSTMELISETRWLLDLISKPQPPSRVRLQRRRGPKYISEDKSLFKKQLIVDSSDSGDSMADFIDDKDYTGTDSDFNNNSNDESRFQAMEISSSKSTRSPPIYPRNLHPKSVHSTPSAPKPQNISYPTLAINRYSQRTTDARYFEDTTNTNSIMHSERMCTLKGKLRSTIVRPDDETQPHITQSEMARLVDQHSASEIYNAAMLYLTHMAMSTTSLSSIAVSEVSHVSMQLALRLWAEYQSWIIATLPTIRVYYPTIEQCNAAQAQIKAMLDLATSLSAQDDGNSRLRST